MLALAGVTPPEDEIQQFIAGFPATREQLAALYAVPDTPLADGIVGSRPTDVLPAANFGGKGGPTNVTEGSVSDNKARRRRPKRTS
jgi:hypothetical protein